MDQASIIGIDLAKHSFQVHGARADGSVAFRKKLSRGKVLDFLASQPPCVVAMEACGSAHHWGREAEKLGHEVKLVPPNGLSLCFRSHQMLIGLLRSRHGFRTVPGDVRELLDLRKLVSSAVRQAGGPVFGSD